MVFSWSLLRHNPQRGNPNCGQWHFREGTKDTMFLYLLIDIFFLITHFRPLTEGRLITINGTIGPLCKMLKWFENPKQVNPVAYNGITLQPHLKCFQLQGAVPYSMMRERTPPSKLLLMLYSLPLKQAVASQNTPPPIQGAFMSLRPCLLAERPPRN